MDVETIKLMTLANIPIKLGCGIVVRPLTLKEIVSIGYDIYDKYLTILLTKKESFFNEEFAKSIPVEIELYDILDENQELQEIHHWYYAALRFLLGTNNITYNEGLFIDETKIHQKDYQEIIKIIKIQNCINSNDLIDDDFNPANERVRKLREKQLENRRKIQELKKNSGDDSNKLTFFDLISILCANANGINILNVFDLNMFQFNDQFNRMKLLNDYEVNIQSILHGADPKKIDFKHWMIRM